MARRRAVAGLARSDAAAQALRAAGASVRAGSLDDLGTLRAAAVASDGVVHLAFKHDIAFSGDFAGATAADRAAIETFGEALAGTGKPFVIASGILGVLGLAPGAVATERDGLAAPGGDREVPISGAHDRMSNAHYTTALAGRGVRSAVSVTPEQAGEYVGFLGRFWAVDGPASARLTRGLLGWEPTRPGLIADLKEGHYFA